MNSTWDKVSQLDLNSVRAKFAFKKGWWWTLRKNAKAIEGEYRQFLHLIAANPGKTVVPWSQDLDDFWHEHILDTARYARDCNTVMGGFIHHNPNLPEGSPAHSKAFGETRAMFMTAFKERAAQKRAGRAVAAGCGSDMPSAFVDFSSISHDTGGHHGGDAGHGHGCGGHGHGCGGHGCGGHGCGGHGCGGHGCGGHG